MSHRSWMEKTGATPGKLALVAVLAVVFVGVVGVQVSRLSSKNNVATRQTARRPAASPARRSRTVAVTRPSAQKDNEKTPSVVAPTWPDLTLSEITAYDPFRTPAWSVAESDDASAEAVGVDAALDAEAARRRSENEALIVELRDQGATIVVLSSSGNAARIGDRMIRVGDRIGSFQITNITRTGVELTEIR